MKRFFFALCFLLLLVSAAHATHLGLFDNKVTGTDQTRKAIRLLDDREIIIFFNWKAWLIWASASFLPLFLLYKLVRKLLKRYLLLFLVVFFSVSMFHAQVRAADNIFGDVFPQGEDQADQPCKYRDNGEPYGCSAEEAVKEGAREASAHEDRSSEKTTDDHCRIVSEINLPSGDIYVWYCSTWNEKAKPN